MVCVLLHCLGFTQRERYASVCNPFRKLKNIAFTTLVLFQLSKGLSQAETLAFASAVSAFAVSQSNVGVSDIALLEPILANVKISVIEG